MRIRWPRCGFNFMVLQDPENRRFCEKPWGHWIRPGSRHAGPVVGKLERK